MSKQAQQVINGHIQRCHVLINSCAIYATKEDQEDMAQKEEDVIARYYFSRYG